MTLLHFGRKLLGLVAMLIHLAPAFAALTPDELLDPEKAFQISTRPLDEQSVEVRFAIADGYYMYRDRFRFETASGKLLADVELPPGKLKKDAFFGETQTYRREAVIRVPIAPEDRQRGSVKLKVTSQGCADVGVCYVPQEQMVEVALAGAPRTPAAPADATATGFMASAAAMTARMHFPLAPQWALALGALLIIGGVWFRAIDSLPQNAGGVVLVLFGAGLNTVPVSGGHAPGRVEAPAFDRVTDVRELDLRVRGAGRITLLDFYADWCVTCKEMERFTFSDAGVRARMLRMQLLQADVTRNTEADKALLKRFGLFGPPAILFFDDSGREMRELRVIGFQSAAQFGRVLDSALRGSGAPAGGSR